LGPADEILPEPIEAGAGDKLSDRPAATPEFTLPDSPSDEGAEPIDDEAPIDEEPAANGGMLDSVPAEAASTRIRTLPLGAPPVNPPTSNAPTELPASEPELAPPTAGAESRPHARSASAVERFRRAVSTVQFVEPRATK
jgi:hypothetical protein